MKKNARQTLTHNLLTTLLLVGIVTIYFSCATSSLQYEHNPELTRIAQTVERETFELGKKLWFDPNNGGAGPNCESCHANGTITNAETYPRYKLVLRTMATLSMTHNYAVVHESKGTAWELGGTEANAIALYVTAYANGKKLRMAEPLEYNKEWINKGKSLFNGEQLSTNGTSCTSCHGKDSKHHKNNPNSPGNLKGICATYPKYSHEFGRVITLEQQINYCIETHLKGTLLALDSDHMVSLCCYLTSMSKGKRVSVAQFDK